ncbi:MAG: hypothetical protein V4692_05090, partial [Bdellovibrionota bacterium]
TFNNADCSALPRPNGSCTFRCQCGLPPTPPEPPPPQCGASGALSFNCATGETVDGVCGATEKSSYEQTNSAFCGASGPNNLSWVRMTCTPDPTCVGAPPPPPAPTPSDFACQFRRPFGWGGRSGSHCIEYFLSVVSPLPPPEDLRAGEHVAGRATYCNPSEGQCYGYFEAICQPDGSFQYTTLDCGQGLEP